MGSPLEKQLRLISALETVAAERQDGERPEELRDQLYRLARREGLDLSPVELQRALALYQEQSVTQPAVSEPTSASGPERPLADDPVVRRPHNQTEWKNWNEPARAFHLQAGLSLALLVLFFAVLAGRPPFSGFLCGFLALAGVGVGFLDRIKWSQRRRRLARTMGVPVAQLNQAWTPTPVPSRQLETWRLADPHIACFLNEIQASAIPFLACDAARIQALQLPAVSEPVPPAWTCRVAFEVGTQIQAFLEGTGSDGSRVGLMLIHRPDTGWHGWLEGEKSWARQSNEFRVVLSRDHGAPEVIQAQVCAKHTHLLVFDQGKIERLYERMLSWGGRLDLKLYGKDMNAVFQVPALKLNRVLDEARALAKDHPVALDEPPRCLQAENGVLWLASNPRQALALDGERPVPPTYTSFKTRMQQVMAMRAGRTA